MQRARERTDKQLSSTEKQIAAYYDFQSKRVLKIFEKYYKRHKEEFDKKYEEYKNEAITKEEYKAYMVNRIMLTSDWQQVVNRMVDVISNINQNALGGIVNNGLEQIYIDNYNTTIKSIGGELLEDKLFED